MAAEPKQQFDGVWIAPPDSLDFLGREGEEELWLVSRFVSLFLFLSNKRGLGFYGLSVKVKS